MEDVDRETIIRDQAELIELLEGNLQLAEEAFRLATEDGDLRVEQAQLQSIKDQQKHIDITRKVLGLGAQATEMLNQQVETSKFLLDRLDLESNGQNQEIVNQILGLIVDRLQESGLPLSAPKKRPGSDLRPLEHLDEFVRERGIGNKTIGDYRTCLRRLESVCPKPLGEFTKADILTFKRAMLDAPAHPKNKFGDVGFKEAIELNNALAQPKDKIGTGTVGKKYGSNLRTFFGWAFANDLIGENPTEGISFGEGTKASSSDRFPFSVPQLQLLFDAALFRGCRSERQLLSPGSVSMRHTHYFWTPLIGAFSAMRLGEILGLRLEDIVLLNDRHHFRVTRNAIRGPADEIHSLKSAAAERDVPIHPELIRIGLLDYWQSLLAQKATGPLFPRVKPGADGYLSSPTSKWFNRFRKSVGLGGRKLAFHSLRHSMKNACRASGVDSRIQDLWFGHSDNSVAGIYGTGQLQQAESDAIDLVRYEGLDLRHLYVR